MRISYVWAGLMTIAIVGWMATGEIIEGGTGDTVAKEAQTDAKAAGKLQTVRVRSFQAQDRAAVLTSRGRTEAVDRVRILAETTGLVAELPVDKGDTVAAGDLICRIEPGARKASLLEAMARVDQTQLDYDATLELSGKGYATAAKLREQKAAVDTAAAALEQMELDMARLDLHAPFDGIVEEVPVEKGSLLDIGGHCATVVALNPMRVVSQISERDISDVKLGMTGHVSLVTGQTTTGTSRFIARTADPNTRTFRVEIEIDNPDGTIRDGVTAQIRMDLDAAKAHLLPSSLLTLNDDGEMGVRTVDKDNVVGFVPVKILADGEDGIWVSGLPPKADIITVGQDYVTAGQTVAPVMETAEAAE